MPISEAKKRANRKWDEENRERFWRATVVFPAEEKAEVMAAAERRGMSFSDYARRLIRDDMEREKSDS